MSCISPSEGSFYNAGMRRTSAGHSGDKHAVHLALVQRLRAQAGEVQRLAAGLDEETLATRGVPGKWSMKELICHCRRMESIFGERLNRMLTEETTIVPYDESRMRMRCLSR